MEDDVKQIMSIVKIFFKDKSDLEIFEIAKHTNYEHCMADEIVFELGSVGDKFYLILRGEIGVMMPSKNPKPIEELQS